MIFCELHINRSIEDTAKSFPKVLTEQIKQLIKGWHHNLLPGHFRLGAARKYGYQGRSIRYQRFKQKKMLPALVFSGRARNKLTRPAFFRVSASKGKGVGKFIVGSDLKYFYMTPSGHPNKAKEMVSTTKQEQKQMRDFLLKAVPEKLNKIKTPKRVVR